MAEIQKVGNPERWSLIVKCQQTTWRKLAGKTNIYSTIKPFKTKIK